MVGAVLFLFTILLSSASSFQWKSSVQLKSGTPYTNITFQFNPQVDLTVEVEYDTSIELCLQEYVPVADVKRWSDTGCTLYVSYGAPVTTSSASTSGSATTGAATTGDATTGDATTGDATTGDATTGDATTGDATTGDATTGDATTGDATTGDATTGDATTGDATTGDATTGDATTGDATTGDATTGDATTGDATTGDATTGDATTGDATSDDATTTGTVKRIVLNLSALLANTSSVKYMNRDIVYYLGFVSMKEQIANVTLNGADCNSGDVYNGANCVTPTVLTAGSRNITLDTGMNFFSFITEDNTGSVNFELTNAPNTNMYLRFAAAPSATVNDAAGTSSVSVNAAAPGMWFLAVNSATSMQVTSTLQLTVCGNDKTGPMCSINVTTPSVTELTMDKVTLDDTFKVYRYDAVEGKPLWVSVLSDTPSDNPSVLVGRGYLPTSAERSELGALADCNQAVCNTNSIKLDNSTATQNQTWFILVTRKPGSENNETSFGIWFGSDCAPDCGTPNGECGTGDNLGLCQCTFDYTGQIACTNLKPGLRAQYIVLIIIAALVVASAIIGFVAWAYMRRSNNKEGYQRVT